MKKLDVIFTTHHSDTVGNACRIEMIDFLHSHFKITLFSNQPEFSKRLFPDTEILPIKNYRKDKNTGLMKDMRAWRAIAGHVRASDSDAVFMFHDTSPASIWIEKPVFQYVHQYGSRSSNKGITLRDIKRKLSAGIRNAFVKKGLQKSVLNFTVSHQIIDLLGGEQTAKYLNIPHAVSLKRFRYPVLADLHKPLERMRNEDFFLVMYTGWMADNRGFRVMLEALQFSVSSDKKIALVLVGSDPAHSKKAKEFADKEDLNTNIIDFGIIDSRYIPGMLYYSDVCLSLLDDLPAFHLSPPQKVVEYFAAGKPVICNDITPHNELVENEKDGLITSYDAHSVSQAILRLKNDQQLQKSLSQNASRKATGFDLAAVYGGMVEKINHVLHDS